jgi:hypothetical protein
MESDIISPEERMNLVKTLIKTIKNQSDETLLELGLVKDIKPYEVTYHIVNKNKWFLAKIKYGI